MRQSTKISYFFFLIALVLELLSSRQMVSDFRLFVGVFVVLGISFMMYSVQEITKDRQYLLFKDGIISKATLIEPQKKNYHMKSEDAYLWIKNSVFLDWKDKNTIQKFLMGIVGGMGNKRPHRTKNTYVFLKPKKDFYISETNFDTLKSVSSIELLKEGNEHTYYSKASILGFYVAVAIGGLSVLALIIYIILQLLGG